MNCTTYQAQIALHIEGDLQPSHVRELEAHLGQCPACQRFQRELQASQSMVKELAHELPDPASFEVVRHRVMQQISRPAAGRRPWWRLHLAAPSAWRPLGAAACVLVLGLVFVWQRLRVDQPKVEMGGVSSSVEQPLGGAGTGPSLASPARVEAPPPKKEQHQPGGREWHVAGVQTPSELAPVVAPEPDEPLEQGSILEPDQPPVELAPQEPEPLVIKLVTDDPNIVIVWLVDQKLGIN